ncbi:Uncharacterised protein [Serratia marcescens]|nr:Uncharacterised protein [Serratia marcescens]
MNNVKRLFGNQNTIKYPKKYPSNFQKMTLPTIAQR